jgi:hypothetical protein
MAIVYQHRRKDTNEVFYIKVEYHGTRVSNIQTILKRI